MALCSKFIVHANGRSFLKAVFDMAALVRIADVAKFKKYSIYTIEKSLDWVDFG